MLRAGDQLGPYTLIANLGRGAFGTVWLSERRTMIATTTAALKIPLDDDIDLETIKHEANLWVRASGHPNVLPIIEANIYDEQVVIASEYAPDGSLESWLKLKGGKASSVEAAVEIIFGVLAGLEHLHSRNIIHRDLKPANILFQGNTPRLADFGISRVLKSTSQSSIVAGTPSYMAPEAFDGKRSAQTDVWSVGVIFYQLLGGRLPFPQTDITSLVGAILSRNPDPLPSSIPQPLQEVISRALSKDKTKRFRSAAEMRSALRKAAEAKVKREYVIGTDVNQSVTTETDVITRLSPFPKILRLHISFIVLLSVLIPGLGSLLIRGWKAVGVRSISLLLAIPIAFLVFGPLWGEVIFAWAGKTMQELGLWPFLMTCLIVPIISVKFALQDRELALAIADAKQVNVRDPRHDGC
jgi:serine/threonine protein kinase